MPRTLRLAVIFVLPAVLAACSGFELGRAEKITPTGSAFQVALYREYVARAKAEYDEYDFADADKFAQRAMAAGTANDVGPEPIGARDLPADARPALIGARTKLLSIRARTATSKLPLLTARAQAAFDCWMQEQEENFQPADIAACRGEFYDSVIRVEEVLDRVSQARAAPAPAPAPQMAKAEEPEEPAAAPAAAPAPAIPVARETIELVVYFPFDSADLTPANRRVVKAAAARIKRLKARRILVIGHADRAGNASYNLALSDRRAESVRRALIADGIAASRIRVESYGEAQPVEATADGVASVFNRRVTISF